ncbi:DUF6415 family natural product biosynthesis protein [Streptoverticillium reticulum]|uniref:DUF6415 family natural product biosynthesis protein n=1 Tax=Streptoverticillium reticulum TaxID=1433415 RepID=UPI0039BF8CA0
MNAGHPPLPVRSAETAREMNVEPARRLGPGSLLDLLSALKDSFIKEDVDDDLEKVLGLGAVPLDADDLQLLVPRLRGCLWPLVTDALQLARGHPDKDLVQKVGRAHRLDEEGSAKGFAPTNPYARRLAWLILELLDMVAEDDDAPLPDFGAIVASGRPA